MIKDDKLAAAIWREGLRRLAEEIKEYGPLLVMIAEMLDRLLHETGHCQCAGEIATFMLNEGIGERDADFVADAYAMVDMLRTGSEPIEVYCWDPREIKIIREKAEASL